MRVETFKRARPRVTLTVNSWRSATMRAGRTHSHGVKRQILSRDERDARRQRCVCVCVCVGARQGGRREIENPG